MPNSNTAYSASGTPPGDADELSAIQADLDESLLVAARDELEHCSDSPDNPPEIADALKTMNFDTLERTHQHLNSVYDTIHDPTLLEKNRFVDAMDLAIQNLSLLTTPFYEEFAPEDAITDHQARRFVVDTYDTNQLIRQHAAAKHAHRELSRITTALKNNSENITTTADTSLLTTILQPVHTLIRTFQTAITTKSSTSNHPAQTQSPDSTSRTDTSSTADTGAQSPLDERDITWENPSAGPNPGEDWVDDREPK